MIPKSTAICEDSNTRPPDGKYFVVVCEDGTNARSFAGANALQLPDNYLDDLDSENFICCGYSFAGLVGGVNYVDGNMTNLYYANITNVTHVHENITQYHENITHVHDAREITYHEYYHNHSNYINNVTNVQQNHTHTHKHNDTYIQQNHTHTHLKDMRTSHYHENITSHYHENITNNYLQSVVQIDGKNQTGDLDDLFNYSKYSMVFSGGSMILSAMILLFTLIGICMRSNRRNYRNHPQMRTYPQIHPQPVNVACPPEVHLRHRDPDPADMIRRAQTAIDDVSEHISDGTYLVTMNALGEAHRRIPQPSAPQIPIINNLSQV